MMLKPRRESRMNEVLDDGDWYNDVDRDGRFNLVLKFCV